MTSKCLQENKDIPVAIACLSAVPSTPKKSVGLAALLYCKPPTLGVPGITFWQQRRDETLSKMAKKIVFEDESRHSSWPSQFRVGS
jgi:hypothetical protein